MPCEYDIHKLALAGGIWTADGDMLVTPEGEIHRCGQAPLILHRDAGSDADDVRRCHIQKMP